MPFLTNLQNNIEASEVYLQDLYNSVILKDVIKRNNIRDVDLMERVVTYIFSNIGHTFSSTSISKYFKSEKRKVSHDTILNYIKACSDAFLLYKINREEVSTKKILSVNEKYYIVDQGILNSVYNQKNENIDQILENIVCLELLRRSYKVTVGKVGTKEIDFIAERHGERIYIQVAYLMPTDETRDREFSALQLVPDQFEKLVLSMDRFNFSQGGIKHRYLPDFLLGIS